MVEAILRTEVLQGSGSRGRREAQGDVRHAACSRVKRDGIKIENPRDRTVAARARAWGARVGVGDGRG
jgi:hypothetical protein